MHAIPALAYPNHLHKDDLPVGLTHHHVVVPQSFLGHIQIAVVDCGFPSVFLFVSPTLLHAPQCVDATGQTA